MGQKVVVYKKTCKKCNKEKDIRLFPDTNDYKDGKSVYCHECITCWKKNSNYGKSIKKTQIQNKKRLHANYIVNSAIKKGIIKRSNNCQKCGVTDCKIVGHHHNGYEEASILDVLWVCSSCHRKEHNKINYEM